MSRVNCRNNNRNYKATYKDDGHHSKDHDCLALTHRLFSLLHGFISLDDTGLLLLKAQKIIDLKKD